MAIVKNGALDVNERLRPDVVILDEAQRIKNWNTKTAQAVKRLRSRYAFVLSGTPIENKIDEIYSLMDFLNPSVLGPLFRFNRDFYEFDERGHPCGYRQLEQLHARIRPYMLRRRKSDVETELPDRADRNHFVALSPEQRRRYAEHEHAVAMLANVAKRRPLRREEHEKLMRELQMMRMTCDTNYILDPNDRSCPKLEELRKILEECRENPDVKVVIFSEWERMIELAREVCERLTMKFALHTGSVPQRRRRMEIQAFKSDPNCRVFLSTDSGGTGLNLQNASVVINCDLPWSPARLEQRIGRVWRKHQSRLVSVINLIAEDTIEHRMLGTLDSKQALADGVLDLRGDFSRIKYGGGRHAFLERLDGLVSIRSTGRRAEAKSSNDPSLDFANRAAELLGKAMIRCEERYPTKGESPVLVVVVQGDPEQYKTILERLHRELARSSGIPLEVVSRATDDALKRFAVAGLVSSAEHPTRVLSPALVPDSQRERREGMLNSERAAVQRHRETALRKARMARLLMDGGFEKEARPAVAEALLETARGFAVARRLALPGRLEDAMAGPLAHSWGSALLGIWRFVKDETASPGPALEILSTALDSLSVRLS